jgi:hypothetical protein
MTDTTKIEKWAFPFKTAGDSSAEVTDPQLYYNALAKANSGFYPLGANGLWHGGVHFDAGTGALLEQSAVRCIADGEVIAYRIDERYPKTQYGNDPEDTRPFSTGFVLVKHRLELPPLPTTAAATPASTAPAAEALTFYSLYMHLRDWAGYRACPTPEVPDFIGEKTYSVKPDKAVDAVKGLKVRAGPKPPAGTPASVEYTTELALLPKGCKIKVGDPASATSQWHKLESILQGSALPALSETQGWVYVGELEATPEPNIYLVGAKANDSNTTLAPQKGLNVRSADKASLLGLLPVGSKFKIAPGTGDYRELKEITEGMDIAPLKANSVVNILGYVHWASLQANLIDPTFDQVVPLNPPIPIKAGELVGHLGQYQNHDGAAQTLLHLEVFSCEDVPAFITKSQSRASSLPDSEKTLIKVDKHSTIIQPSAADGLIASGMDVRLCSDSPTQGCWAKVQRYAVFKANKTTELGTYSSGKYSLNASQKTLLAARLSLEVAQMPDTLDFLNEIYTADGSEPLSYTGSAPATHPMRKVGAIIGASLWVERNQLNSANQRRSTDGALPAWSQFPLQSTSDGISSGYERILPGASWDGLPHARKAIDDATTRWWYVTVGDINGNDISGWAPEKDLIVTRHSPWEWPGFSTIMETATPADLLPRALHANGQLTPSEVPNYKARIDTADQGVLLKELYKIIDVPDRTGQRDGLLSASELKAALAKPWLAQQLSLLISHYESEWFWNQEKWDALDPLMAPPPATANTYWVAEKARIEKLSWWDKVEGQHGIEAGGMAWHFHVAGLIGTHITNNCKCLNIERFVSEYKIEHQHIFGWFEGSIHTSLPGTLNTDSENNLKKLLEMISKLWPEYFDECNNAYLAYMLATIRVESYDWNRAIFFGPICEKISYDEAEIDYGSGPTGRRAADAISNHNTEIGDGYNYRGRGLVQITWKINYEKFSNALDIDFTGNPELALDLENSTRIMLHGMRDGLFSYGNTLAAHLSPETKNYYTARKIINGTDRASVLKYYAEKFETLISRTKN